MEAIRGETKASDPADLTGLMQAYQQGSGEAFEELYVLLKPRLYRYLCSLTWNSSQADDLLQETFLQLHRSRKTYQPGRPVLPWAFAIARHVFLAGRRARGRRERFQLGGLDDLPEIPVPPEVEGLAKRDLIHQALRLVPENRREALLMHHVWGFTFEEIGGLLGIRQGTAKLRAYRGMQSLRKELEILSEQAQQKGL